MTGSVQKKGNSYYIVFRTYDSKTGRKKQRWVTAGKTRREAERKLTELMGEVHNGTYRELKRITFAEFSELWVNSYAKTKTKPSTLKSYEDIVSNHLVPAMGDYFLTEIDTGMLQKYVAIRLGKVKPKTVKNELVPLKEMFKHAVTWGYLKNDPAKYIESPRVEKEEMDILSPEEIKKFLEHVRPKYKTFFMTAIQTGMRRGELLGLQWNDIDWDHNQIHVKRALWHGQFVVPKTKASRRKIDISTRIAMELGKLKISKTDSKLDLVFCNSEGDALCADSLVKRQFLPALKRAGIRKMRFHDLRHTNVALRIEKEQNYKYIKCQLGHASIQTTIDRYGHLFKDVDSAQANKMDDIFDFPEHSGDSSDSVRSLLEDSKREGVGICPKPLNLLVAGVGFEPTASGL